MHILTQNRDIYSAHRLLANSGGVPFHSGFAYTVKASWRVLANRVRVTSILGTFALIDISASIGDVRVALVFGLALAEIA